MSPSSFLLAAASLALAAGSPALAVTHHHGRHATKTHKTRHSKPEAPNGAMLVPAGGLKVYCPRKSPLMVRKMTQGAGTTVTVICR